MKFDEWKTEYDDKYTKMEATQKLAEASAEEFATFLSNSLGIALHKPVEPRGVAEMISKIIEMKKEEA